MMRNKLVLALLGLLLVLGFALKTSINRLYEAKQENDRLHTALTANGEVLKQIETLDGKLAAQNRVMELKIGELNELYPTLQQEIKNLKIKENRVEQVAQTIFHTQKQIKTLLKDSIVMDTIRAKVFDYKDDYYTIKGMALKDTQHVTIHMRDTLLQVVYRGKRKHPWLWIFSKRQLEQRIALKNPNAKIEYNKVIQIQIQK